MTDALLAFGRRMLKERGIVDSGDAETLGIGAMTEARWTGFFQSMLHQGIYKPDLDLSKAATIRFVDKGVGLIDAPPLIRCCVVDHVDRRFANGAVALADVSLSVGEHDFVALLGPSGCGKSTLLRLIAALDRPDRWPDHSGPATRPRSASSSRNRLSSLGPLPSTTSASPSVSSGGDGRDAARDALARVGLAGFEAARPRQLSGGMRMRVSLARALITAPRLLLLDEPFAALDEFTRHGLQDDLRQLWHADRSSILFVTHSIYEAAYLARRIVIMSPRPGRIAAEIGSPLGDEADRRLLPAYAELVAEITRALRTVHAA